MISEKKTKTAVLYCSNIDTKYGNSVFPIINVILCSTLESTIDKFDYVVKTDIPQPEITTSFVDVSVPVNLIPVENIVNGKIWTEILSDPITDSDYQLPLIIDEYTIPVGTSVGATSVDYQVEKEEVTYVQNYQDLLDSSIRGYLNKLVIDISSGTAVVREKVEAELVVDEKENMKTKIKVDFENEFNNKCDTSFGFAVDCKQSDIVNWMATLQMFNLLLDLNETEVRDYNNKSHI